MHFPRPARLRRLRSPAFPAFGVPGGQDALQFGALLVKKRDVPVLQRVRDGSHGIVIGVKLGSGQAGLSVDVSLLKVCPTPLAPRTLLSRASQGTGVVRFSCGGT